MTTPENYNRRPLFWIYENCPKCGKQTAGYAYDSREQEIVEMSCRCGHEWVQNVKDATSGW